MNSISRDSSSYFVTAMADEDLIRRLLCHQLCMRRVFALVSQPGVLTSSAGGFVMLCYVNVVITISHLDVFIT